MGNVYLDTKRKEYEGLRTSIEGLQNRAAEEKRDLNETELRSVQDQGERAKAVYAEIEALTEIETRNRKVAELAGSLVEGGDTETRSVSNTTAKDRDPGHYRSEKDGGQYSFFSDLYKRDQQHDREAASRLDEHSRALSTGVNGTGVVPPKWLTNEFAEIARMGRPLADAVRRIPLGDDPRPLTLPKQTASTDSEVTEQANENDEVEDDDAWNSNVDTVTPKPTSGIQIVSRQMLDMSSPAIDQLIYADLMGAYNEKVEAKVGGALVTASGTAVSTLATEAAFIGTPPASPASDAVIEAAMAVWQSRKRPADLVAMRVRRWGAFKKLRDADGRPLFPSIPGGTMGVNVHGVGEVNVPGEIEGLGVIVTDGLGTTAYPENLIVLRASDTILFESNVQRFSYEQPLGPQSVKLGIWGYTAVLVRYAGQSSKRVQVTAATA